jgi:hypothetical protein
MVGYVGFFNRSSEFMNKKDLKKKIIRAGNCVRLFVEKMSRFIFP